MYNIIGKDGWWIMEGNLDTSDINLALIEEITDVYEICNEYRRLFCFTVTLTNQEIINVFRKFTESNREQKEKEIKAERQKLYEVCHYYEKEYKNQ